YIDGKLVSRVNLFNEARVTTRQVFTHPGMKDGQHTLRIVKVSGEVLRSDMIRYTIANQP
ncbi:MAG: alpha-galactosidase, partial [Kribbellaceae bacterium]|nr:alpha-galactosidase [Kribbellaceae bacterium]